MTITRTINSCADCRHIDHSGAFTKGGAQAVCGHGKASEMFGGPGEGKEDYYHWKHCVINTIAPTVWPSASTPIPQWCPLKRGAEY